jgi:hypothetical protein
MLLSIIREDISNPYLIGITWAGLPGSADFSPTLAEPAFKEALSLPSMRGIETR